MLVEQEQDLRKLGEDWRMSIFQQKDQWQVVLSKDEIDGPMVLGVANNPKRAFRQALEYAKSYEDNLKKVLDNPLNAGYAVY